MIQPSLASSLVRSWLASAGTVRFHVGALSLVTLLAVACGSDGDSKARPTDAAGILAPNAPGRPSTPGAGDASVGTVTPTDGGGTAPLDAGGGAVADTGTGVPGDGGTPLLGDASTQGDAFFAKLRGCGLLGAGNTMAPPSGSKVDDCLRPCLLGATCQELNTYICDQNPTGSFLSCAAACLPPCAPITGTADPEPVYCDNVVDCKDGTDEVGCDPYYFVCNNGTRIARDYVCEGDDDCGDGSDELGCAAPISCGGTEAPQPARYACDHEDDCSNGADEVGCAAYICN